MRIRANHWIVICAFIVLASPLACGSSPDRTGMHRDGSMDGDRSSADGGVGSDGGANGTDAMPLAGCMGRNLSSGGALDLDIKTLKLSGNVTLNGQALPGGVAPSLVFIDAHTRIVAAQASNGRYAVTLAPGIYRIRYQSSPTCTIGPLPCGGAILKSNLAIHDSGALDLDIQSIQVSGAVTFNGGTLPDETMGRGQIVFLSNDSLVSSPSLGTSGPGHYAVMMAPGTYEVRYNPEQPCTLGQSTLPCNAAVLASGVNLAASGALDVDVKAVHISGSVTLNHQPMPTGDRGAIGFSPPGSNNALAEGTFVIPSAGAADYALDLAPGTYDVTFLGRSCTSDQTSQPIPCNSGPIHMGAMLTSSSNLDLDVPAVTVQGRVTTNGATLPSSTEERGSLSFAVVNGGSIATPSFGQTGNFNYSITLFPGSYSIGYQSAGCPDSAVMPCNSGVVQSGVDLSASGTLDVDIRHASVGGNVKLNGAQLPEVPSGRGALSFSALSGGSATRDLGTSGAGHYTIDLIAGTYAIGYGPLSACPSSPMMPCNSGVLLASKQIDQSGAIDVDIPAITLHGMVTLNGGPLASPSGQLAFLRLDASPSAGQIPLGASYSARLLPGTYVVSYEHTAARCDASSDLPCDGENLIGCPAD